MGVHGDHYSSSANKADAGFYAETTNFFSTRFTYWGDNDKKRSSDIKCFRLRGQNTDALLLKFTTVIAIIFLVEWDMWRMRFDRNLPENGNLTCMFKFELIFASDKKIWEFEKMPPYCCNSVATEISSFPFLCARKSSCSLLACTLV